MRRAAALLALSLAAVPRGADGLECPRGLLLAADGLVSRVSESPHVAAGGRLALSSRCVAVMTSLEWTAGWTRSQPAFGRAGLVGLGAMADVTPRVSLHAYAVAGGYGLQVRDYIEGGWRDAGRSPWALGASAGVRWRVLRDADGRRSIPFGMSAAILRVSPERDRLRGVAWGGWVPMLTLSLGVELRPTR